MAETLGTLKRIKVTKGARKALSIDMKLGKAARFYKSDIRKLQKAMMSLPDVLHKSFETAVGKKKFVDGVRATFARTAQAIAGQTPLAEATIIIREYLASERGYPAVGGNQVMVHSGSMLTRGVVVGATGKGKSFTLWVGFSAKRISTTASGTPTSNQSYAEIAQNIESGFSFPDDEAGSGGETAQQLFEAAGLKYNPEKHGGMITVVARPFIDMTARVTLAYVNNFGLKMTEEEIPAVAADVVPF